MTTSRTRDTKIFAVVDFVKQRSRTLLALLLVLVSGVLGAHFVPAARGRSLAGGPARRPRAFDGAVGPWGKLHYKRIWIEPPPQVLGADRDRGGPRWFFRGFTPERLHGLFGSLPLPAQALTDLTLGTRWRETPEGVWVMPPPDVAASLAPEARVRIYDVLAPFPENRQHAPIPLDADLFDEQLEASHLTAESAALLRRLVYPKERWLLFADELLALSLLRDPGQRTHFLGALSANPTYLVTLDLDAGADVDALTRYWALGNRPDDRGSLLRAAADLPGGSTIALEDLLPPFARRLLYTYPNRALDPALDRRNCFWTALNFFSDAPEDRLAELGAATERMHTEYTPVSDPTFGDLVVVLDERGLPLHAAVYLADQLVFTKNGGGQFHPWIYMTLPDLVDRYKLLAPANGSVREIYLRHQAHTAGPPPG